MSKFDKVLEPWFNNDNEGKKYLLCATNIYGEENTYVICDSIQELNESIDYYCECSSQIALENSFIVPINDIVPLKEYINYCKSKGFQFSEC